MSTQPEEKRRLSHEEIIRKMVNETPGLNWGYIGNIYHGPPDDDRLFILWGPNNVEGMWGPAQERLGQWEAKSWDINAFMEARAAILGFRSGVKYAEGLTSKVG